MGKVLPGGYRANKMMRFVVPLLAAILVLPRPPRPRNGARCRRPRPARPSRSASTPRAASRARRPCRSTGRATRRSASAATATGASRSPSTSSSASPSRCAPPARRQLYIGDIGQPRGGPMSFGHASHQVGLDVDIWFERQPGARRAPAERENPRLRSLVRADDGGIDDAVFTDQHVALLRMAASIAGRRPHVREQVDQAADLPDRHRQSRLAAQARALVRPRRAFPRPAPLPARAIRSASRRPATTDDDGCGEALDSGSARRRSRLPPPGTPRKALSAEAAGGLPASSERALSAGSGRPPQASARARASPSIGSHPADRQQRAATPPTLVPLPRPLHDVVDGHRRTVAQR